MTITTPEEKLWYAVLGRALDDLYLDARYKANGYWKANAQRWFKDKSDKVYRFKWICLILGLNIDKGIEDLKNKGLL